MSRHYTDTTPLISSYDGRLPDKSYEKPTLQFIWIALRKNIIPVLSTVLLAVTLVIILAIGLSPKSEMDDRKILLGSDGGALYEQAQAYIPKDSINVVNSTRNVKEKTRNLKLGLAFNAAIVNNNNINSNMRNSSVNDGNNDNNQGQSFKPIDKDEDGITKISKEQVKVISTDKKIYEKYEGERYNKEDEDNEYSNEEDQWNYEALNKQDLIDMLDFLNSLSRKYKASNRSHDHNHNKSDDDDVFRNIKENRKINDTGTYDNMLDDRGNEFVLMTALKQTYQLMDNEILVRDANQNTEEHNFIEDFLREIKKFQKNNKNNFKTWNKNQIWTRFPNIHNKTNIIHIKNRTNIEKNTKFSTTNSKNPYSFTSPYWKNHTWFIRSHSKNQTLFTRPQSINHTWFTGFKLKNNTLFTRPKSISPTWFNWFKLKNKTSFTRFPQSKYQSRKVPPHSKILSPSTVSHSKNHHMLPFLGSLKNESSSHIQPSKRNEKRRHHFKPGNFSIRIKPHRKHHENKTRINDRNQPSLDNKIMLSNSLELSTRKNHKEFISQNNHDVGTTIPYETKEGEQLDYDYRRKHLREEKRKFHSFERNIRDHLMNFSDWSEYISVNEEPLSGYEILAIKLGQTSDQHWHFVNLDDFLSRAIGILNRIKNHSSSHNYINAEKNRKINDYSRNETKENFTQGRKHFQWEEYLDTNIMEPNKTDEMLFTFRHHDISYELDRKANNSLNRFLERHRIKWQNRSLPYFPDKNTEDDDVNSNDDDGNEWGNEKREIMGYIIFPDHDSRNRLPENESFSSYPRYRNHSGKRRWLPNFQNRSEFEKSDQDVDVNKKPFSEEPQLYEQNGGRKKWIPHYRNRTENGESIEDKENNENTFVKFLNMLNEALRSKAHKIDKIEEAVNRSSQPFGQILRLSNPENEKRKKEQPLFTFDAETACPNLNFDFLTNKKIFAKLFPTNFLNQSINISAFMNLIERGGTWYELFRIGNDLDLDKKISDEKVNSDNAENIIACSTFNADFYETRLENSTNGNATNKGHMKMNWLQGPGDSSQELSSEYYLNPTENFRDWNAVNSKGIKIRISFPLVNKDFLIMHRCSALDNQAEIDSTYFLTQLYVSLSILEKTKDIDIYKVANQILKILPKVLPGTEFITSLNWAAIDQEGCENIHS